MEGSQARGSQARGWGYPEHDGYGGGGGWRMQADRESGLRANVGIAHGPGGSSRCVCVYVYVYVCMCVCVCVCVCVRCGRLSSMARTPHESIEAVKGAQASRSESRAHTRTHALATLDRVLAG